MHELLPGYVLGILDPDEKQQIQEYLATSPDGWEQVHALDDTISYLAYYAPPVALPKESKARVLSYVQRQIVAAPFKTSDQLTQILTPPAVTPIQSAVPIQPVTPIQSVGNSEHLFPKIGHEKRPFWSQFNPHLFRIKLNKSGPSRWRRWWNHAFAWKIYSIAATGAVVLLALLFNQTQSIVAQTNAQLALVQESNAQLQLMAESYDRQFEELRASVERPASVVSAPIQQVVLLEGTERYPQANGSLLAGSQSGYLILTGIDPLQDSRTYQLWLIPNGQDAVSSGLVALPAAKPVVIVEVDLTLDVDSYARVGLSIEPAGGSKTPTTEEIVLLGSRL